MNTKLRLRFGRHIARLRKNVKLTQEQLAREVGYTTTSPIGYIETGKQVPKFERLPKFAKALNVKVRDLFPF